MMSYQTFAQFRNTLEAHVMKSKLDAAQIESVIQSEQFGSLYPGLESAVKLMVKQEDFDEAAKVIQEDFSREDQMDFRAICPQCGSQETRHIQRSRKITVLSWVLIGIPFAFLKQKWKCDECHYRWKF